MMDSFDFIIGKYFYEIKSNFQSGLKKRGLRFDEDIFSDSYLKCCETLGDKEMTKKEALKYFWVAYINRLKTPDKIKFESFEDSNIIDDDEYDHEIDELYNILMEFLNKKFDNRLVEAWRLHFEKGIKYDDLRKLGYDFNFNPEFKKIMRYIRNKLSNESSRYKELVEKFN